MKIKKFLEYVDNTNNDYVVPFNKNEINYLSAKAFFCTYKNKSYIDYTKVDKLSSGEYLVVKDNVKCSTLQSLVKYLNKEGYHENAKLAIRWFDDILKNITINYSNVNAMEYYYNDSYLGECDQINKCFNILANPYYKEVEWLISNHSFAARAFISDRISNVLNRNGYSINLI